MTVGTGTVDRAHPPETVGSVWLALVIHFCNICNINSSNYNYTQMLERGGMFSVVLDLLGGKRSRFQIIYHIL